LLKVALHLDDTSTGLQTAKQQKQRLINLTLPLTLTLSRLFRSVDCCPVGLWPGWPHTVY